MRSVELATSSGLITDRIDFAYGFAFTGFNLVALVVVYFGLIESKGKTLEELDTAYLLGVDPRKSKDWAAPIEE